MKSSVRRMELPDLVTVVDIHVRAFPDFFLSRLGVRFLRQFYAGVLSDPTALALIALEDGRITGFAAGTREPRGFYRRLLVRRSIPILLATLPVIAVRPGTLIAMLRRILRRTVGEEVPSGAELMSVAVDPASQGRGIGAALVRRFNEEARAAGASSVWLTTDAADNDAVRAFYTRLGFRQSRSFTTAEGRPVSEYVQEL